MRCRPCTGYGAGTARVLAMTAALAGLLFLAGPAVAQFAFSQATEDRDLYMKSPDLYEKEPKVPSQPTVPEIYIAKRPAVNLPLDAILAVVVDRQPVLPDREAVLAYLKDRQSWETVRGRYYLSIYLSNPHSKLVADFLNQESGHLVAIRLNNHVLAINRIVGSFSGRELGLYLTDTTPDRLKMIFAPIESQVVWK
jgi:hypothetical protein